MPLKNPLEALSFKSPKELEVYTKLIALWLEHQMIPDAKISPFSSISIPEISLAQYLYNCVQPLELNEWHFIFLIIYLERYCKNSSNHLTPFNIHRLSLNALCLADKFHEDNDWAMSDYASVGGLTTAELNKTVTVLFSSLGWSAFVSLKEYLEAKKALFTFAKEQQSGLGIRRFLFSFSKAEEAFLQELIESEEHDRLLKPLARSPKVFNFSTEKPLSLPMPIDSPQKKYDSFRFYNSKSENERDVITNYSSLRLK